MQLINLFGWTLLFTYYFYRIYKKFFSKKNINNKKLDKSSN
jgi:hypothetical protein